MSTWKKQKRSEGGWARAGGGGGWDASRGNRDPTPFGAPPDHQYGPPNNRADASRGSRDPTPFGAPPDHQYGPPHVHAYQEREAYHGRAGRSYSHHHSSSHRNQGSGPGSQDSYPSYGSNENGSRWHGYQAPRSQNNGGAWNKNHGRDGGSYSHYSSSSCSNQGSGPQQGYYSLSQGTKNPPQHPSSGGHHGYQAPPAPPSQDNNSSDIPVLTKPWEDMTPKEQYQFLLPDEETILPPLDFRPGFHDRQQKAVERTKEKVRELLTPKAEEEKESEYEDEDDMSSSEDSGVVIDPEPAFSDVVDKTTTDWGASYSPFIDSLPRCTPLTLGFHALFNEKLCYCPCGRHMSRWRKLNQLEIDEKDKCDAGKGSKGGKREPYALIKHLEDIPSFCHDIIKIYLEVLYEDYMCDGVNHKALYDVKTPAYNRAETIEKKERFRHMEHLQLQLDKERKEKEVLEGKTQRLQELEKVNQVLAKRMKEIEDSEQNLRKHLNMEQLSEPPKKAISEKQKVAYRTQRDEMFQLWREALRVKELTGQIQICVRNKFKLSKFFSQEQQNKTFLFSELNNSNCGLWLKKWDVRYCHGESIVKDLGQEVRADLEAQDEGGPTRAFVSDVMRQIDRLSVYSSGNKKVALFGKTYCGWFTPQTNEFLEIKLGTELNPQELRGLVHQHYRALGRILFYCLAKNITIASIALPALYQNYLLRGIDPEDERYLLTDLVHDVTRLVRLDHEEGDYQDAMCKYFQYVEGEKAPLDHDAFRLKVKENFIDGCDIALESLKEGLSLGDRVNLSLCFGSMPLEAVNMMAFSKLSIRAEDLLEVMEPIYDDGSTVRDDGTDLPADPSVMIEAQQKILRIEGSGDNRRTSGALAEILRRSEEEFARKFLFFVTGYLYVPMEGFKIEIEFNLKESKSGDSLPVAHTCDCTLKLPALAYGGDAEVLEEKLEMMMAYVDKVGFDMQ